MKKTRSAPKARVQKVISMEFSRRLRAKSRTGKNPGLSAWLSALLWGTGQIYAESMVLGLYFFIAQVVWMGALVGTFVYTETLFSFWQGIQMNEVSLLYLGTLLSLGFSLTWMVNIFHAYRLAERQGRGEFQGIDSFFLVLLGGGWLPGLGQLLNGQPRKALFFIALPFLFAAALGASIWSWNFWPLLHDQHAQFFAEAMFLGLPFLFVPCVLLGLWSLYDASMVNFYPGIRDSIWKRIRFSWNRFRREPLMDKVRALPKKALRYGVVLGVLALGIYGGRYWVPAKFYADQLNRGAQALQAKGLSMTPQVLILGSQYFLDLENSPKNVLSHNP